MSVRVLAGGRLKAALLRSLAIAPGTIPDLAGRLNVGEGVTRAALIELREAGVVASAPKGYGGWRDQVWGGHGA